MPVVAEKSLENPVKSTMNFTTFQVQENTPKNELQQQVI